MIFLAKPSIDFSARRLHIPPIVRGGIDMHIHAMFGKDISASISVIDVSKNISSSADKKKQSAAAAGGAEDRSAYARVDCIAADEAEVLTSGSYRGGYCVCSTTLRSAAAAAEQQSSKKRGQSGPMRLQAGDYTVVLSAYTQESVGNFALTFATSAGAEGGAPRHAKKYFSVSEVPAEGHGLRRLSLAGAWADSDQSAAGCVNFGSYHSNPIYVLHVSEALPCVSVLSVACFPHSCAAVAALTDFLSSFMPSLQLPEDAVLSARLNTSADCGVEVALNLSVFALSAAAPADGSDGATPLSSEPCGGSSEVEAALLSQAACSDLLRDMSASPGAGAAMSSNQGVYVARSTGAFVAPAVLRAGTYLTVPSTFAPTACRFTLDVFVTPSVAGHAAFRLKKAF